MAMDPNVKVVLGSIAFAIFWALAVFPAVPFLPIGRTAGSLLGAMLMVLFQVLTPEKAYAAIDLPILGLLFGTMVVGAYLERADMFEYLGKLLSWKSKGAKDLLCRICLISAVSSAFLTNDVTCVVLTEFVLKIARQQNLPPLPFVLALESSANIGSSATQIGNPQNLVITVRSKITFARFLFGILPAMVVGVFVNALILLCMYWNLLSVQKDEEDASAEVVGENDVVSHRFSPATMSHLMSSSSKKLHSTVESMNTSATNHIELSVRTSSPIEGAEHDNFTGFEEDTLGFSKKWKGGRKACVYIITLGMLLSFLVGLNMSWTAITGALALIVLDFKDARPCLEKVSYSLLIFFCGMFITVEGFNETGIPHALWKFMDPYAKIGHISGTFVLAVVIILLSNLVSNVPAVLLLGAQVATSSTSEEKLWLILAWASTVAGNFSLLGSAANLIVREQAGRSQHYGYNLSFWSHLKFGVPSTIIVTAIGLALIRG